MAIGIVAEFNPFHNGHKYLMSEAMRITEDDTVICVMSGSWVQRGEPAITDKWTRAEAALKNGSDLVIELPVIYSLNTAQKFAYGAIATLAATGSITTLAFGSECGDIDLLRSAAHALISEPPEVSNRIRALMSEGYSFAAARATAYNGMIPEKLLSSPNDILAVEYIRAAVLLGWEPRLIAIKRFGTAHDGTSRGNIASAAQLRRMLCESRDISLYAPCPDFPIYDRSALDLTVIAKLRGMTPEQLKSINDISEGLENRFIKAAGAVSDVDSLCTAVKSKRYALSRIRRIAYSSLLGIDKDTAALPPSYIRILGMTRNGTAVLKEMKNTAALPVIIKAADCRGDRIFSLNSHAEDIFSLCAPYEQLRQGGRDLTTSPIVSSCPDEPDKMQIPKIQTQ